ncbi:FRG domain-containing protein [Methylosarcina fibrata]|uniref:FRG domain-containing protein n=1 Tax=Methylosarcina fibrata TaxID=105972 RepID=UPI0003721236|nr:FRG domain-containing protein [Methylosarcina fibrata]
MQTIRVKSWESFDDALKRVRRAYGQYVRTLSDGSQFERHVKILYRGQADAKWPLLTTLERKTNAEIDVLRYVDYAARTVNELESFTGTRWSVAPYPDLEREVRAKQDSLRVHLPAYDYLVHLRHHGFPSPLLDWTESPYIAAYFAYLTSDSRNPAVYCYIESPTFVKVGSGGSPMISLMGPYVSTHRRHFAQRASYTVCTRWDQERERHVFCKHENVFARGDETQDVLVKLVLPARDRLAALRRLSEYNINHFTLFQSEDALVKSLETRYFDLGDA